MEDTKVKVYVVKDSEIVSEAYRSLDDLLLDLSLEWGIEGTTNADYIDIRWGSGVSQRLHKGKDY